MKFRKRIIHTVTVIVIFFAFSACRQAPDKTTIQQFTLAEGTATGAYFTRDQHNEPVLCWTEKMSADSLYRLRYARYDESTGSFSVPITVPVSAGSSIAAESMGKIAFKADGTVMAIFAKRFVQEKSPYAGAIYYSSSSDQGKTWSPATFIHADTAHHYGRSFFDIARLRDGELAAVWLDGRYGKEVKGSALFFARTEKGGGFTEDICVEKGTCECCRTNLTVSDDGTLHIAYRSIMYPTALFGAQVRDMAYVFSADNGKTFSKPQTISEDHWEIDGCPHSGPSMAVNGQGLNVVWFTAGGKPGLYYSRTNADQGFKKRALVTENGRHPQMTTLKNGKLALVFEEGEGQSVDMHSEHAHAQAGVSKVMLTILKDGKTEKSFAISNGKAADHHAVVTPLEDGVLTAWMSERHGKTKLYYRWVANL